jgi:hypothetical protein
MVFDADSYEPTFPLHPYAADSSSCRSDDDDEEVEEEISEEEDDFDRENPSNKQGSVSATGADPLQEMQKYADMENKLVRRWRRLVIGSILSIGALVGGVSFVTLKNAQSSNSIDAVCSFSSNEYVFLYAFVRSHENVLFSITKTYNFPYLV